MKHLDKTNRDKQQCTYEKNRNEKKKQKIKIERVQREGKKGIQKNPH